MITAEVRDNSIDIVNRQPGSSKLGRALCLLLAFRPGDTELTLAELARRTNLPKPTAHRLLGELAAWDLVERTDGGHKLGVRLFELGTRVPLQYGLRETAAPFLSEVFELTGSSVNLAVLDGPDVVYVDKLRSRHGPAVASRLGERMPSHCTGVGKALLAHATPATLELMLRRRLQRRTRHTIIAPGLIVRDLRRARERGYAIDHEESTMGIACVAAPLLDTDGRAVAAVSVTSWAHRLNLKRIVPAVHSAARDIARALAVERSREDARLTMGD
ncbi:IclR family transcriptional regulator [Prauserella flavalba]|uniref:IclR family transcriptional regulator n=1 Tax=Prauserella flavalba TaxID=1477506 RepID=UPI0036E4BCFB